MTSIQPLATALGLELLNELESKQLIHSINILLSNTTHDFPGNHPVSLTRDNIRLIFQNPKEYWITEKSDGTRYLLISTKTCTVLMDRALKCLPIPLLFPKLRDPNNPNSPILFGEQQSNSILDGELILELNPATKKHYFVFLTFDMLAYEGNVLIHKPLQKRFGYANMYVDKLRKRLNLQNHHSIRHFKAQMERYNQYMQQDSDVTSTIAPQPPTAPRLYNFAQEPILFSMKEFYLVKALSTVFKDIIPRLNHENDGLVFTRNSTKYVPGTCHTMMKWKPVSLATVDFKIQCETLNWNNIPNVLRVALYVQSRDPTKAHFGYLGFKTYSDFQEFCMGPTISHGSDAPSNSNFNSLNNQVFQWNNKILECRLENNCHCIFHPLNCKPLDPPAKRWTFYKFRDDKSTPNAGWVAQGVISSIEKAISKEQLLKILVENVNPDDIWNGDDDSEQNGNIKPAPGVNLSPSSSSTKEFISPFIQHPPNWPYKNITESRYQFQSRFQKIVDPIYISASQKDLEMFS